MLVDGLNDPMFEYMTLEIRRVLRDRRYIILSVGFPLGFYLMYTRVIQAAVTINNTPFATFYMVSMATFGALGASLQAGGTRIATERASGWVRQLRVTPLPAHGYLMAKIGAALCLTLPAIGLVAAAGRFINHVSLGAGSWIEMVGLLWVGALPFAALGILLGFLFDVDSAQAGTMITYFALAILGGLWWPFTAMPLAMRDLGEALPSYHFANLGWSVVKGAGPRPIDFMVVLAYAVAFGALTVWKYRGDRSWQGA